MDFFITCKPGFDKHLSRELALYHFAAETIHPEAVVAHSTTNTKINLLNNTCFGLLYFQSPIEVKASSVNDMTEQLLNAFIKNIGTTRIETQWNYSFLTTENEGLPPRAKIVETNWIEKLKKKMSRVAKLAVSNLPSSTQYTPGFFVYFVDFNRAFISFNALSGGQQRMQMDDRAPSRSYLKLEEAFHLFGFGPKGGDTVIDLGAAPGGWSYSVIKRGARVVAIDNGPLKDPVKSHPLVKHLLEDAFRFAPEKTVDWLLCDMVEQPDMIINLIDKWLKNSWCKQFVVNLKIGRTDPVALIKKVQDPQKGLAQYCSSLTIRQLYHDREEITLLGTRK